MTQYICIDLKSFYASVECVERALDPDTCCLVVADPERTDKTICLAVSTALKAKGVKNRCRVFEIPKHLKYITAPPRMQKYIDYSVEIYGIYLKYFSHEDIHVYSIDEVFIDVTAYLTLYSTDARTLAKKIIDEIHSSIGIRAAAGIGTNLYLAKIALDITAKHSSDYIGELSEESFCNTLWDHTPLTDFWRIGKGTASRLNKHGIYSMRDIAQADEGLLYKLFGIDAELLIDHAWGRESTTIKDIKNYSSKNTSITSGQVLMRDYSFDEGLIIAKEMTDVLCLDLKSKKLLTDSLSLHVGYAHSSPIPFTNGSVSLKMHTNQCDALTSAITALYKSIVSPNYCVRRINISYNRLLPEDSCRQINMFENFERDERLGRLQDAVLNIKSTYGKNAILKGMNFQESATTRERNRQIGGHKSG